MAKIKTMANEDLLRWRTATVDKQMVEIPFPGMSVEEGRRALLTYFSTLCSLLAQYGLSDEEDALYISPVDGGIYTVTNVGG